MSISLGNLEEYKCLRISTPCHLRPGTCLWARGRVHPIKVASPPQDNTDEQRTTHPDVRTTYADYIFGTLQPLCPERTHSLPIWRVFSAKIETVAHCMVATSWSKESVSILKSANDQINEIPSPAGAGK